MKTNDKTLADAQPGGRVRLGDQNDALAVSLRQIADAQYTRRQRFNGRLPADVQEVIRMAADALTDKPQYITDAYELGMRDAQALSAQPSPGGQGDGLSARAVEMLRDDARLVGVIADNIERGKLDHPGFYRNTQLAEVLRRVLSAALAARQPVEYSGTRTCGDERPCINCYSDIGDCLGPAPSQGNANHSALQEPVAWISRIRCVGPEYGKEIYGKLPVQSLNPLYYEHIPLYAAPPAQAVDLERARDEGHDGAIRYVLGYLNGAGNCGSTAYDEILNACGRERIIRSAVEDGELEFTGLGRWVEMYGTAEDRALIDSQAVGK